MSDLCTMLGIAWLALVVGCLALLAWSYRPTPTAAPTRLTFRVNRVLAPARRHRAVRRHP